MLIYKYYTELANVKWKRIQFHIGQMLFGVFGCSIPRWGGGGEMGGTRKIRGSLHSPLSPSYILLLPLMLTLCSHLLSLPPFPTVGGGGGGAQGVGGTG